MSSEQFYSQIPKQGGPLSKMLAYQKAFHAVPSDWHVVITDIKGSTGAVLEGRQQEVNRTATGSIVTVLNIAFRKNITVPFFFGGDGATFLLPAELIEDCLHALRAYQVRTKATSSFDLRVGTVSVEAIYARGHKLMLGRFSSSANLVIPILLGNGLNYAEQLIKGDDALFSKEPPDEQEPDLTGMQCRWDRIPPPDKRDEVITLLVAAKDSVNQANIFQKVIDRLDHLYGPPPKRQPITIAKLRFRTSFSVIRKELRDRLGRASWLDILKNWLINLYGPIFFRTRNGKKYLRALVEMSDTLVIDGKINTVISGTAAQRIALENFLDELEGAGELIYGLHVSQASVMSCYVRDLKYDHIHFIDGAEGGYTQAARILKQKL